MKRKIIIAAGFILMTLSFSSCEKSCKICQQNEYNSSGTLTKSGSESEYCGTELLGIEATPPVTVLGTTTKWVCR